MKTVVIGDIHGRTDWKEIVGRYEARETTFVFLGDYLDSHEEITVKQQCSNFSEILEFKRSNPENVVLLMGNHDLHYFSSLFNCSGFSGNAYKRSHSEMEDAVRSGLIKFIHIDRERKIIFSHAGVSEVWLGMRFGSKVLDDAMIDRLETEMNVSDLDFAIDYTDSYGDDPWQGPGWIRPMSLLSHAVEGFTQFVGHTRTAGENAVMIKSLKNKEDEIWLIDCLPNEYCEIGEDGKVSVKKVKCDF
jgi:hypothetical protein